MLLAVATSKFLAHVSEWITGGRYTRRRFWSRQKPAPGDLNLSDDSEIKDKAGGPGGGGLRPGHVTRSGPDGLCTHHTGNGLCLRDLLL